jgi:hypothetical protein
LARYVDPIELEEILAVLHRWIATEIEVSAHGGRGAPPISAVSVRGRLRTGDVLSRPGNPEVFLFVLSGTEGRQVGSFAVDAQPLAAAVGSTRDERSSRSKAASCSYYWSQSTTTAARGSSEPRRMLDVDRRRRDYVSARGSASTPRNSRYVDAREWDLC